MGKVGGGSKEGIRSCRVDTVRRQNKKRKEKRGPNTIKRMIDAAVSVVVPGEADWVDP